MSGEEFAGRAGIGTLLPSPDEDFFLPVRLAAMSNFSAFFLPYAHLPNRVESQQRSTSTERKNVMPFDRVVAILSPLMRHETDPVTLGRACGSFSSLPRRQ
jgi:hypothetical protein